MNIDAVINYHQLTLYLNSNDARALMNDFDNRREPSLAGKRLYEALQKIANGDPGAAPSER